MAAIGAASRDKFEPNMESLAFFGSGSCRASAPIMAANGLPIPDSMPWPGNAGNGKGPVAAAAAAGAGTAAAVGNGGEARGGAAEVGGLFDGFGVMGLSAGAGAVAGAGVGAAAATADGDTGMAAGGCDGMACELDIGAKGKSIDGMEANVPCEGGRDGTRAGS